MHLISEGRMENMYYMNAKFWAPGRSLGGWGGECISPGGLKWKDRISWLHQQLETVQHCSQDVASNQNQGILHLLSEADSATSLSTSLTSGIWVILVTLLLKSRPKESYLMFSFCQHVHRLQCPVLWFSSAVIENLSVTGMKVGLKYGGDWSLGKNNTGKLCVMNPCTTEPQPENQTDQTAQIFEWQNLFLLFYRNAGDWNQHCKILGEEHWHY